MRLNQKKLYLLAIIGMSHNVMAATPQPDAGSLLDSVKNFFVTKPTPSDLKDLIHTPVELPPAMEQDDKLRLVISKLEIVGNETYSKAFLLDLVKDEIGHEIGFNDMVRITGVITKYYRDHGYFVTRAYIPVQQIENGTLKIIVLEGKLGATQVNFKTVGPFIPESLMQDFVYAATPQGNTIQAEHLERSMLLLNEIPKTVATSTLVPGQSVGTSDIVLEVEQSGRFANSTLTVDNYGNIYSGAFRFGGNTTIASPLRIGDQLTLRALTSGEGFNYLRTSWSMPFGGSGLKVGLDYTFNKYVLGDPFAAQGINGTANIIGAMEVYPLIRSRFSDLYQTATFESKYLSNNSNAGSISEKRVTVVNVGLNGNESDKYFTTDGLSNYSATLTFGNLDLSGNSINLANDAITALTAGAYQKLFAQANRQQQIAGDMVIYASVSGQMAAKNLDSSEQFIFGGPSGVRAYPVGEAPADAGLLTSIELRYNTIAPYDLGSLQYQLFYDYANVHLNQTTWATFNTSGIPNNYSLSGYGVGANIYKKDQYLISTGFALPIGNNPNPGTGGVDADGRHTTVRGWVQLTVFL